MQDKHLGSHTTARMTRLLWHRHFLMKTWTLCYIVVMSDMQIS